VDRGATVLRVSVAPEFFLAWCKTRFVKPNRKAVEVYIDDFQTRSQVLRASGKPQGSRTLGAVAEQTVRAASL
jgi:hypothetical protein